MDNTWAKWGHPVLFNFLPAALSENLEQKQLKDFLRYSSPAVYTLYFTAKELYKLYWYSIGPIEEAQLIGRIYSFLGTSFDRVQSVGKVLILDYRELKSMPWVVLKNNVESE